MCDATSITYHDQSDQDLPFPHVLQGMHPRVPNSKKTNKQSLRRQQTPGHFLPTHWGGLTGIVAAATGLGQLPLPIFQLRFRLRQFSL